MFRDRSDAGIRLAEKLEKYRDKDVLVLAVPRGGVEVAYRIAEKLDLELSVVVARKLPFPDNPEAGFGAIAEDGSVYLREEYLSYMSPDKIESISRKQKEEIRRRVETYRQGKPLPALAGRDVILVDDGIAMGSTVNASVLLLRKKKVSRIILAIPVSAPEIAAQMKELCDETVILETPISFMAVAQAYENWHDATDSEVAGYLNQAKKKDR